MRLLRFGVLSFVALLAGCGSERTIIGSLRLEQWEDGRTYYLHRSGFPDDDRGGSYIGGTVLRLGWNTHWILAERHSFSSGDRDGWIIINAQTSALSGPFNDAELEKHPEAKGIYIHSAEEAWGQL